MISSEAELMEKILRHRRQTVLSSRNYNLSLPVTNHSIIFNHVYTIHVPALCTAALEAPDSSHGFPESPAASHLLTEHTVNKEDEIVFTHRIHIPLKACGCPEDLPALRDLLNRLERLEGQVSALKEKCSGGGSTDCEAQVTGGMRTQPYCNGHGNFSTELSTCVCEPSWTGPNCTQPECPLHCRGRGSCVQGRCMCSKGFSGEDCSVEACPVDCGTHGQCVGGQCICYDGFFGEDCSHVQCLNDCLGRGLCMDGECVCNPSWGGLDCSEVMCPSDCSNHGHCVNGTCFCDEGYVGTDCMVRACPSDCHGNGFCVAGQCVCTAGYSGEDCALLTCLNDCSGRGSCFNGVCICDVGYQGEDCSQLACINNCNSRGQCINGRCSCDIGFQGEDCSELSCPGNCHHRGRCINGQCVCHEGFTGEDCSIKTCPSECFSRGTCIKGRCRCYAGFSGDDCSQMKCPNSCRHRGHCVDGQCVCEEGFTGDDCGQRACPNDCMKRGYCLEGRCICQEGYFGDDCSKLACPDNCNNRGRCIKGRCSCDGGYEGESCASRSCLNNCHNNGQCVDGRCQCEEGYTGDDCSDVSPPADLTVTEVSLESVDLSWTNDMLVSEYLVSSSGSRGQLREFTIPGHQTTATVTGLEPGSEYLLQVYALMSDRKSEPVSARVITVLPQPKGLMFTMIRETAVEVAWEELKGPFDGWEIKFRNTKEENGDIVRVVPWSQTQMVQFGLGPGQEYEVSVSVMKNNTRGPQTSRRVITKPQGPEQLQVKDVTGSSALISWFEPEPPSDRVVVSYAPTSEPLDRTSVEIFPPDHQSHIEALRPDTEYTVTLVSSTGGGNSEPVTTTFTTALDAPRELQVVSQSDSSITVQWLNSNADVRSYRVKYSPISGAAHGEELFPRGPGATTSATLTGLMPGTEYGIGVTAVKNERESLPATTNADTDLDPPTELQKSSSSETWLTLTWLRPKAKVSGYRLVYASEDGQVEELELNATEAQVTVRELIPGTSYTFSLSAHRGLRNSRLATVTEATAPTSSSDVLSLTIEDAPQPLWDSGTVPSVPDLDRPSSTDSSIPGSGAEPNNSVMEELIPNVTNPLFHKSLPGKHRLTEQSEFTIKELKKSLLLNSLLLKAEEQAPVVLDLSLSDVTWDSVTASWGPAGGDFDSFVLEITNLDNLVESQNLTLSGDAFMLVLSGLTPNTTYTVGLYGVHQNLVLDPVYDEATTGTWHQRFT